MRFLLFDRVTSLVPGREIRGIKTFTAAEPCFEEHFPRAPRVPTTLLIEAMVQLLAWTAITKHGFRLSCVLTVLEDVQVDPTLRPGASIELSGHLLGTNPKGSVGRAAAQVEGREVARLSRVIYGHVPVPDPAVLRERFRYFAGPAVAGALDRAGDAP